MDIKQRKFMAILVDLPYQCGLRPQPNLAGVTISPLLDMAA